MPKTPTKTPAKTPTAVGQRPTPLHPYPAVAPSSTASTAGRPVPQKDDQGGEKSYPPELGTDSIAILEGRTFMLSDSCGDVPPGSVGGLLHNDTRFVGRWELTMSGKPLTVLKSAVVDYYSASFFLTNPELPAAGIRANSMAVQRLRFVGDGVDEQIVAVNSSVDPVHLDLRLTCGTDFADLFEVKSQVRDRSAQIVRTAEPDALRFLYQVPRFRAETTVRVRQNELRDYETQQSFGAAPMRIEGDAFVWTVDLPPRRGIVLRLEVGVRAQDEVLAPMHHDFGEDQQPFEGPLAHWLAETPRFESDSPLFKSVLDKSVVDLASLRISGEIEGESYVMPAAGLPWFMTLFGRDTLITSLQTLPVGPELARGALHLLGEEQGDKVDDFRDEEPGRILHEVRNGELTVLGEKPHSPYYGASDTTPLWLVLLDDYWRFTGDDTFVRDRWNKVLAALNWIDRYGDRDGDGYIEYGTRSSQGLGNQCWKDSWDGIQFSDGHIPFLPIATVELQGYVYDAKLRVANMAKKLANDAALADRLVSEAAALYDRVNRDFWSDARGGYYIVGLDADKKPIDSMTSNMGHLLWSRIVPKERAGIIAGHLMAGYMFSGWGVRTISTQDHGYNPIGYHCGTIWPHDNAIIATGLARYGFRDEANRIALAQLEAASFSDYRLPEAFAGFERSISRFPVPYPTACSPQAWATGAPFEFLRMMLGSSIRDGKPSIDPYIPAELGRIKVTRVHALGKLWDIEAQGTKGTVRPSA
jgi:glycogen debranching enzyme